MLGLEITVTHRCSAVAHQYSTVTHRCSALAHQYSTVTYRYSTVAHRCSAVAHQYSTVTYRYYIDTPVFRFGISIFHCDVPIFYCGTPVFHGNIPVFYCDTPVFLSVPVVRHWLQALHLVLQVPGLGGRDAAAAATPAATCTGLQRASGGPAAGGCTGGVQFSARPRGAADRGVHPAPQHHPVCVRRRAQGHPGVSVPVPQRALELYNAKRRAERLRLHPGTR
jgi:hypothetical protein